MKPTVEIRLLLVAPLLAACRSFDSRLETVDSRNVRGLHAYSLDPGVTYLNHGSIGTMPRIVQDAPRCRRPFRIPVGELHAAVQTGLLVGDERDPGDR